MNTPIAGKSSLEEIRQRFDSDVDRFSNLDTGQAATIDAPLNMELITQAALAVSPRPQRILDIGCGAGNNTLKLLLSLPEEARDVDCHLLDLSQPMLDRASLRITEMIPSAQSTTYQSDFRVADLQEGSFDVILAAAVLHHLRDDSDWETAFEKLYRLVKPGGSLWITDLVTHESEVVHELMWERYGQYLENLGGAEYREKVFAYIDKEDSPRPVTYQLDLLRKVGFSSVELLHKHSNFAAFGAIKL